MAWVKKSKVIPLPLITVEEDEADTGLWDVWLQIPTGEANGAWMGYLLISCDTKLDAVQVADLVLKWRDANNGKT